MKQILKPMLLTVVVAIVGLLGGCSSSLDPNAFNVELNEVDTSNWYAQNQSASVLTIRSNSADPIDVTNVKINNGECSYEGYRRKVEYPQHFKMGLRLRLQLTGCNYSNVVQVDVETDQGTASYSFQ